MERRIAVAGIIFLWLVIIFVVARVLIPALVNSQNDGALIAVPLLAFAVGTAAYVTYVQVLKKGEQ